jgi:hypothetical protein
MVMLLLPRLRVVFAGRLYIHPLEEAGKNIFQEIFVLFRRGFSCIGVINSICTASSLIQDRRCQAKFLTSAKYLTKRDGSEISRLQARNI